IQLLFLFNREISKPIKSVDFVSIQLLFLFNIPFPFYSFHFFCVSIQLLFLFNKLVGTPKQVAWAFQYSFCSYSTDDWVHFFKDHCSFQYSFCSYSTWRSFGFSQFKSGFNTASVLIQPSRHCGTAVYTCVSIQLLFLFNNRNNGYCQRLWKFQYSFCSYST